MIQIKKIDLFDENNIFLGSIKGPEFQKIGNYFFEILSSKENDNIKYLRLASLFRSLNEDIASHCFNKVDQNKLNVLDQLLYVSIYKLLIETTS